MKAADALALPLEGLVLIEASAGTGKTTALVNVYLRALLLEGREIGEILAVTYTEAATGELSTRVRKRLLAARAALAEGTDDEFLQALLRRAQKKTEHVADRIEAALRGLDEAAIFTIHGFCRRTLGDRAFEAAMPFTQELVPDETELNLTVAADFWRRRMAAASPAYAAWLLDVFKAPDELLRALHDALQVSGALTVDPHTGAADAARAEAGFEAAAQAAAAAWREDSGALRDWLLNSDDLNRRKYHKGTTARLLDEWEGWLAQPPCSVLPKNFERLTSAKAEESLKKGSVPDKPFFQRRLGDALKQAAEALAQTWWRETFAAAFAWLHGETRRRKRAARRLGYDDMLERLAAALAAPGGEVLAARIAARYPLALIDEFQDTDALQYEIFSRIYDRRAGAGLVLIGDPKQAIYRFRGADVFTYMRARRECAARGRIARLGRNYRATAGLVAAVNGLFGAAQDPFVYAADIPFEPVEAAADAPPLTEKGKALAPLRLLWLAPGRDAKNGVIDKGEAVPAIAAACAAEIARLIGAGAAGDLRRGAEPVRAQDLAVLVRTHRQGRAVQRALAAHGVAAVMLSRESVFATAEAADLQALLAAVAEPGRSTLLRRALATPLLGLTAAEIAALDADGEGWTRRVEAFRAHRRRWQEHGFTPMFFRLLREEGVIERTLARADGERAMTNLRHLAELAEAQSARRPGVEPLLGWLARECRAARGGDETKELRLESDESLVRIVTVHKAKGLEYPVVFLPFLCDAKAPQFSASQPAILTHDDLAPVLDLGSDASNKRIEEAQKEARAEEARLAYVALTRAKHACYVALGPVKDAEHAAVTRLLGVSDPAAELAGAVRAFAGSLPDQVALTTIGEPGRTRRRPPETERGHGEARAFRHPERLRQRFFVASYSALAPGSDVLAPERPDWDEAAQRPAAAGPGEGIHAFPAGAATGRFWHALIEGLPFAAGAETIRAEVGRAAPAAGFEPHWSGELASWLAGVFATPLAEAGFALRDVGAARRVNELEFYFPLAPIDAARLEAAARAAAPQRPRPPLAFDAMQGLMKGYVDLVFEHGGRYWLADYKSNRLGADAAAYTPAALDAAMAQHRYDLQYLIYTVALHRWLRARLEGYAYEQHFGGVFYLFLRGMAPAAPAPRGVWYTRPPAELIARLDALLAGGAQV